MQIQMLPYALTLSGLTVRPAKGQLNSTADHQKGPEGDPSEHFGGFIPLCHFYSVAQVCPESTNQKTAETKQTVTLGSAQSPAFSHPPKTLLRGSSFETLPSPFLSKLYHSSWSCCSVLGWRNGETKGGFKGKIMETPTMNCIGFTGNIIELNGAFPSQPSLRMEGRCFSPSTYSILIYPPERQDFLH